MLLLLLACAPLTPSPVGETLTWSGYLFVDPLDGSDLLPLETGRLTVTDPSGADVHPAEAPYADSPAWWSFETAPEAELALRVSGPGLQPTVFRTKAPARGAAFWFQGTVYAVPTDAIDALLASLLEAPLTGALPQPLAAGQTAALWLAPLVPENWPDVALALTDGLGNPADLQAFTATEGGYAAARNGDPIDLLLAADLAPGPITLTVTAPGAAPLSTTWPAQGGDLLVAPYYTLPGDL